MWGKVVQTYPCTVFNDMGEPAISIKCQQSFGGDFESLRAIGNIASISIAIRPSNIRHINASDLEEILVPGAGLNGLRILPEVHKLNAYTQYRNEHWPVFDDHFGKNFKCSKLIHLNDSNPFVAAVWNCLDRLGKFPTGLVRISFTRGDLGSQDFLDKVASPTRLIISQVQAAGPESLTKLIETTL